MQIKIQHQEDKIYYTFKVRNANNLTSVEVKRICIKMSVKALFINGKYYTIDKN